jgi:hypothetical protein
LVYESGETGTEADGNVSVNRDAQMDGVQPLDGQGAPEGGANGDGAAPDAAEGGATDASTDAPWTNTCPGLVPPGATQCDGNTACFERKPGGCSSESGNCQQQCGSTKLCCVNAGGNVFCRTDPSQCP